MKVQDCPYSLTRDRFIISNAGFTIERTIHGWEAEYNNIVDWDVEALLKAFGALDVAATFQARTRFELEAVLGNPAFIDGDQLRILNLSMAKEDVPRTLKLTAEASG